MKSTKLYSSILMATLGLVASMPVNLMGQKGPNFTDPEKRTKTVRGCVYEVLPGLAEITSIKLSKAAELSALQYDEHQVRFKFTPMEGGELLAFLQEEEIDFVLRSRNIHIPVGPAYIQRKNLKIGTKYAMNLLQTNNKDACLERYTFESKALDNDLFEAEAYIIPFTKANFGEQQRSMEAQFQDRKTTENPVLTIEKIVAPVRAESSIYEELKNDPSIDWVNITTEELQVLVEEKMKDAVPVNNFSLQDATDFGINVDSMEHAIRTRLYKELDVSTENNQTTTKGIVTKTKAQALRDARKATLEKERQNKRLADQAKKAVKERDQKIELLRANYEKEIEAEIRVEIEAKKTAVIKEQQVQQEADNEKAAKKAAALEKLRVIQQETKERLIQEEKRKQCLYSDRIAGTIEVVKVSEAKSASESRLKHVEYSVLLSFRPDNYAELSKKDQKVWEGLHLFSIDPKGASANPGPGYLRKYSVFKSSRYQGFVQVLEGGVCNEMLFFSPDLPIDVKQLKLK